MKFVLLMHIGIPDATGQKHSNFRNGRWHPALILKNRRGAIYPQSIDQFCWNLARWYISALWTPSANKIL